MKCKHCGYEWICKSKLIYATCPSCYKKTKIEKNIMEENPEKDYGATRGFEGD